MNLLTDHGNESDSKNIFGRYSSKRMSDWSSIMSAYTKDNVHLAEAAHILVTRVNYDL
jgi:hypothetical protein